MRAAMTRRSAYGNDDYDELDSPSTEGIETGTLAIAYSDRMRDKEIWQRPSKRNVPRCGKPLLLFEISNARIMPREGEKLNVKRYVVYDLSIKMHNTELDQNPAIIQRRYTHFLKLFTQLKKDYPFLLNTVSFPKKVLMGNFSQELISERSMAFEDLLDIVSASSVLKESSHFLYFLQDIELTKASQYLNERRNELAVPILENTFCLLNKVFMDRSRPVLLVLCRLVSACTTSPIPHSSADKWAELALRRYEGVCDTELLALYIPLLHTCSHLWWQRGRDKTLITTRLGDMSKRGITVVGGPTLYQALQNIESRDIIETEDERN